jgi:hypothetical protein
VIHARAIQKAIRDFDVFGDGCVEAVHIRTAPPPVLWHYGQPGGLRKMLASQNVRLRCCDSFDDKRELHAADEAIVDAARRLLAARHHTSPLCEDFISQYPRKMVANVTPIFVFCFSTDPGNAHLWEQYARGDDSNPRPYGGYAIGLEYLPGEKYPDPDFGYALEPVSYDARAQGDVVFERLREVVERAARDSRQNSGAAQRIYDIALSVMFRIAALVAVQTKDPVFEPEREWRFAAVPRRGVARGDKYKFRPFREGGKLARIATISLGSACTDDEQSLRSFLGGLGYGEPGAEAMPEILRSGVRGAP